MVMNWEWVPLGSVNSLTAITSVGISPYLQVGDGGVDGAIGHSLNVRGRLLRGERLNMLT